MLESKKGCSRQPVKIWVPETEQDWQENMKLEAQLLTHDAEVHRLKEELEKTKDAFNNAKDDLKKAMTEQEERQTEILKLKRQIVEIESCAQK